MVMLFIPKGQGEALPGQWETDEVKRSGNHKMQPREQASRKGKSSPAAGRFYRH